MEYTAVNLFHVAAFEVKALVASIVPNLKLDFFSKLITPLVRKFAILFPLFLVVVTYIHNWVEPVILVRPEDQLPLLPLGEEHLGGHHATFLLPRS